MQSYRFVLFADRLLHRKGVDAVDDRRDHQHRQCHLGGVVGYSAAGIAVGIVGLDLDRDSVHLAAEVFRRRDREAARENVDRAAFDGCFRRERHRTVRSRGDAVDHASRRKPRYGNDILFAAVGIG